MTIVHVIEPGFGGSMNLVISLLKFVQDFNHIVIYCEKNLEVPINELKKKYLIPESVEFYKWEHVQNEISLVKDIKATYSLFKLLKKLDFNVIHLHSSKAGFIGRLVCFWLGFKNVIYTTHAISFLRKDVSGYTGKLFVLIEKIANKLSGQVICCSKSECEELKKQNIASTYINNGTEIFDTPYQIKDTYRSKIKVVNIARATFQKNPKLFNEIAKKFEDDSTFEFIWIGDGDLEYFLESTNIKVTGWLNKREVEKLVLEGDIYLSTSLWEGLPLAVLEAMNLKKPLILNNCVGNNDLVIEKFNGFLYETIEEAVERIKYLNDNRSLIEKFGNNSRILCEEKFSISEMALNYKKEYIRLIEEDKTISLNHKKSFLKKKVG